MDDPEIRGFSVKRESSYIIYLLNKSSKLKKVNIHLENMKLSKILTVDVSSMVDTEDHWGKKLL